MKRLTQTGEVIWNSMAQRELNNKPTKQHRSVLSVVYGKIGPVRRKLRKTKRKTEHLVLELFGLIRNKYRR